MSVEVWDCRVREEAAVKTKHQTIGSGLSEASAPSRPVGPVEPGSTDHLRQVLEHHRAWVGSGWELGERADLHGADLHASDLQGMTLRDADLHEANLEGADLHAADLDGADLHGAKLTTACLHHAFLHWADLHGADLHGADLRAADLRAADLSGADLTDAALDGADIRGADLRTATGVNEQALGAVQLDADTRLPARTAGRTDEA